MLSTKADPAGSRSDPSATSATRSAAASVSLRRRIKSSAETFRRKFRLRRWSSSSPRTGKRSARLRSFLFRPEDFFRPFHFRFEFSPSSGWPTAAWPSGLRRGRNRCGLSSNTVLHQKDLFSCLGRLPHCSSCESKADIGEWGIALPRDSLCDEVAVQHC